MSHFRWPRESGAAAGRYRPHEASQLYSYVATWSQLADDVHWEASIDCAGTFIRPVRGRFDLHLLGGGKADSWVRAAVELEIAKIARL